MIGSVGKNSGQRAQTDTDFEYGVRWTNRGCRHDSCGTRLVDKKILPKPFLRGQISLPQDIFDMNV